MFRIALTNILRAPQQRNELLRPEAMKWLDFARISVYYEHLLLIPFNGRDGGLQAVLEPRSQYHIRLIPGVQ